MTKPATTATVLAKLAFAAGGAVLTLVGFAIRTRAYGGLLSVEALDPSLARSGSWLIVVGAGWLLVTIVGWVVAPGAWDALAPFIVGIALTISIVATILVSAALSLTGRPGVIDPSDGFGWRLAMTLGVLTIGFAQWVVARALVNHDPPIGQWALLRLKASAVVVVVLGTVAAWTSPVPLVVVLTLAALVYIAIELTPRG